MRGNVLETYLSTAKGTSSRGIIVVEVVIIGIPDSSDTTVISSTVCWRGVCRRCGNTASLCCCGESGRRDVYLLCRGCSRHGDGVCGFGVNVRCCLVGVISISSFLLLRLTDCCGDRGNRAGDTFDGRRSHRHDSRRESGDDCSIRNN